MSDKQYETFVIVCLKSMLQFNASLYTSTNSLREEILQNTKKNHFQFALYNLMYWTLSIWNMLNVKIWSAGDAIGMSWVFALVFIELVYEVCEFAFRFHKVHSLN